jgi:hypothetical protein
LDVLTTAMDAFTRAGNGAEGVRERVYEAEESAGGSPGRVPENLV